MCTLVLVMKPISLDLYKYIYKRTRAKEFSYFFALAFVAMLHVTVLYGFSLVLALWMPRETTGRLFHLPWVLIPWAVLCYLGYKKVPFAILSKEKVIQPTYATLLLYILLAVVIVLYGNFIK